MQSGGGGSDRFRVAPKQPGGGAADVNAAKSEDLSLIGREQRP